MACNSIAMSTDKITKVNLTIPALKDMMVNMLGIDASKIASNSMEVWAEYKGGIVTIEKYSDGEIRMKVESYAGYDATLRVNEELAPKFDSALALAQQTAIIKRLGQLGKLSKIQGKDNGVSLRLEINV